MPRLTRKQMFEFAQRETNGNCEHIQHITMAHDLQVMITKDVMEVPDEDKSLTTYRAKIFTDGTPAAGVIIKSEWT